MPLDPNRTALVFPGQGSQAVGMGKAISQAHPEAAEVFAQADELLGYRLSHLCWQGPEVELNSTEHTQPALLTHSVAVLRALGARFPALRPSAAAGHSLGEISALVAAGSITFTEALSLVRERGLAMKAAGEQQPGGMAAVLGLDAAQVESACAQARQETGGGVWLANDNCPGQVVISGDEGALERAGQLLEALGARKVVRLAVSIAAHSAYMNEAQQRFSQALDRCPIGDPSIPVYGNVSAEALHTAEEVRADLETQLTSNVRWTDSIRRMRDAGMEAFVEIGPGNVLSGLIRRIDPSTRRYNLDTPESFDALEEHI